MAKQKELQMPRRPRVYQPGYAYHIYQRGNNRASCFIEQKNYHLYLKLWRELSAKYNVAVHAYCLMTNHIHFLVTPTCTTGISNTMKYVGSRYAQTMNRNYDLTGSLWEGRHHSSLVDTNQYFFTCMRYIELNPVRAKMVSSPEKYQWSSYRANALGHNSWVKQHAEFLALGSSKSIRQENYRSLFETKVTDKELQQIRTATHYSQPIGDIYKLRLTLEPELAASLAGKLSEEVLLLLEANMEQYAYPAADLDEERAQHIASLRFHGILAEQADNPLLGFIVDFMVNLLSDLTVYRRLYSPPNIELWQQGHDHQRALIQALRNGDADSARAIMADHMETAWKLMRQQEVEMENRFISEV